MTPSEIAERLHQYAIEAVASECPEIAGDLDSAAAMIRDLEAKLEQATEALIAEQFSAEQGERLFRVEQAKLMIATEALEKQKEELEWCRDIIDCDDWIADLTQALARMKEVRA